MIDRRQPDPRAEALVQAYRLRGYRAARLDPLGLAAEEGGPELDPGGPIDSELRGLTESLRRTYCGTLGLDAEHLRDPAPRRWLWRRMERWQGSAFLSPAERLRSFEVLAAAAAWEALVDRRFAEHKRFSLEGCETLIPLLDRLVRRAAARGVAEVVMGMAHRGRLNLLVNLLGIAPRRLLSLFTAAPDPTLGAWDLKYHLGHDAEVATDAGDVRLLLAHNPSHLESVTPVVCGMARARQDARGAGGSARVLPVIVHGDAAFCGQGVVMETLNLSRTRGFGTGGTVHVVLDNQIGFTTSDPADARSMAFCTDVARMIDAPVLHVNAEDPDAAATAAGMAADYRARFATDVVIRLVGFRRRGHNEQDIPELTQPQMQRRIDAHPGLVAVHARRLLSEGHASEAELAVAQARVTARLEDDEAPMPAAGPPSPPAARTMARAGSDPAVSLPRLQSLAAALARVPESFAAHPAVAEMVDGWRHASRDAGYGVDWRTAENLAYASILGDGGAVRVTGMDVGRGTFFHRHARWHDQTPGAGRARTHVPLETLGAGHARFDVFDSPLSEQGVLGFEYGYSVLAGPGLVVWEAQYGDFVNNAQVVIDQYVATGEVKWGYRSGLVVLLPHGHEGIGPEHSCAHLGRFLQLCADDNLRVAVPSTSAQLFHLLRRQACAAERKPLVVMTPKSQLHAELRSHVPLRELADRGFEPVLGDDSVRRPERVRRAVVCAGKVHYDLEDARARAVAPDIALVRVEQLHPFPVALLARELARYPLLEEVVWVQEEARNHGAWAFVREDLEAALPSGCRLRLVSRAASAPSAGCSVHQHRHEQASLASLALATSKGGYGCGSP